MRKTLNRKRVLPSNFTKKDKKERKQERAQVMTRPIPLTEKEIEIKSDNREPLTCYDKRHLRQFIKETN